jgi:hypothetical protein
MREISNNDPKLTWSGAISVQNAEEFTQPWRLPFNDLDLYPFEDLNIRSGMASGVRLRFATDSNSLVFHTKPYESDEAAANVDLYVNNELFESKAFSMEEESLNFENLPSGTKIIELWLHQMLQFKLKKIEIDDNSSLEISEDKRPRWITYGSSITHCKTAQSPSFTWPGVVARNKGFNLTSLGFGGQCHADTMIARLIRDFPADFISLKLGINIQGHGSLNSRSFRPAVIGYISTIREKHPETPLAVCSPIWSPCREEGKNHVGFCLKDMRLEVEAAVDAFLKRGDKNIYYIDGLKLFNSDLAEYLPDDLHPDETGYKIMGENFLKAAFGEMQIKVPGMLE